MHACKSDVYSKTCFWRQPGRTSFHIPVGDKLFQVHRQGRQSSFVLPAASGHMIHALVVLFLVLVVSPSLLQ